MADRLQYSLRQLEYFVAVAEEGTISSAADRCRLSQSALSLAISNLEKSMRVRLFVREPRGVTPTAAGESLLASTRHLLNRAKTLQEDARGLGQRLSGRIVLGCVSALIRPLIITILREFPRRHPGVEIDVLEGRHDDVHRWLLEGRCEVGLTYDLGTAPEIRQTVVYDSHPHVLLPPRHRLAGAVDVSLHELREDPLIMHGAPLASAYYGRLFRAAGLEPQPRYRTITLEAARTLVAVGAGYTLSMHHPGAPEASVPLRPGTEGLAVVVSVPSAAQPTRRAQAFVAFARTALAPLAAARSHPKG